MFGITLWELLSRDMPYAGISTFKVGYRVVHEDLRPPRVALRPEVRVEMEGLLQGWGGRVSGRLGVCVLLRRAVTRPPQSDVSRRLVTLMERCWHKDQAKRPSMSEVHAALLQMREDL